MTQLALGLKKVEIQDVREWLIGGATLSNLYHSIGGHKRDQVYGFNALGIPPHIAAIVEALESKLDGQPVPADALDSIPFYSLCRGLLLPLSGFSQERAGAIFGLELPAPLTTGEKEELLAQFFELEVGLDMQTKLACVLGDPFFGRSARLKRDSLLGLLLSMRMVTRVELLDRLAVMGDISILYAESRPALRGEPPLSAAEVLATLRILPDMRRGESLRTLRSLFQRSGKVEAYFLARLVLRKAGLGLDYQGPLLARVVAKHFAVSPEAVEHAMALSDLFEVLRTLEEKGAEGLRSIRLQPLVPVRPSLASASLDRTPLFPAWVEKKYDGIRLMLHKDTDAAGSPLVGAYTRTRRDWLEQVPGLELTAKMLPINSAIIDGELFGTIFDLEGGRPATVYEVHGSLQGALQNAITLRYAAFDLLYLNGRDLTQQPLWERRRQLSALLAMLTNLSTPVPISLSEGSLANESKELNRLYQHFRNQGYEGIISKDPAGVYALSRRDPSWLKRKPEITLDLVITGAVYAVTTKTQAGLFGSYVISALNEHGQVVEVGDVAGLGVEREAEIRMEILREGLLTGRTFQRQSASGTRPGVELRPAIVVTVRFEGITKDLQTGILSLRDPKLVSIRSDKAPTEADSVKAIESLYLAQRFG